MRHTKIIATVGPASQDVAVLGSLIEAGVDVFRLNFSHGSHDSHTEMCRCIRETAERSGRVVGVMQDLSGPKIRTGRLEAGQPIALRPGQELRIATGDFVGNAQRISTTYAELAQSTAPGDRLLLDDGRIELRVRSTDGSEIVSSVVYGGRLGAHKGINAPGVALPASALTSKDREDLAFGLSLGVDMVALSFVETAADLRRARELILAEKAGGVSLIAKIERPKAVANIDDILDACDGIMVARGDLGLELPFEQVPRVQTEITRHARARGLPVIVATQVLESMLTEPRPTRAEVSDAAHSVTHSVDAIMLAGETAVGSFPLRAVETLHAVIVDAEQVAPVHAHVAVPDLTQTGHGLALCEAAVTLATVGNAAAIVAVTRAGKTARLLSALRPNVTVYAATDSESLARQLTLWRNVVPLVNRIGNDVDSTARLIQQRLIDQGFLLPDSVAVFVNVNPDLARKDANFLTLHRLQASGC